MTLSLYFDQHVPGAIARGLRRHGIDVLTTQDDNAGHWKDVQLLARATGLGRIMVSEDYDLLDIAYRWLSEGRSFTGLAFGRDLNRRIGRAVEDLMLVVECYDQHEVINRIIRIPL